MGLSGLARADDLDQLTGSEAASSAIQTLVAIDAAVMQTLSQLPLREAAAVSLIAVGIYHTLRFLFPSPDKGDLPNGYYKLSSWLNPRDNNLIAIHDQELLRFRYGPTLSKRIATLYQHNTPLESIITLPGSGHILNAIPLHSIANIRSNPQANYFVVTHSVKYGSDTNGVIEKSIFEFYSAGVKEHAINALTQQLASQLSASRSLTTHLPKNRLLNGLVFLLLGVLGIGSLSDPLLITLFFLVSTYGVTLTASACFSPEIEISISDHSDPMLPPTTAQQIGLIRNRLIEKPQKP